MFQRVPLRPYLSAFPSDDMRVEAEVAMHRRGASVAHRQLQRGQTCTRESNGSPDHGAHDIVEGSGDGPTMDKTWWKMLSDSIPGKNVFLLARVSWQITCILSTGQASLRSPKKRGNESCPFTCYCSALDNTRTRLTEVCGGGDDVPWFTRSVLNVSRYAQQSHDREP